MERHDRIAKTAANAGIKVCFKRQNLRSKVTHGYNEINDAPPVANGKKEERLPLKPLLSENKQQPKRQDEADKSKADHAKQSVTKKGKLPKAPTAAAVSVAGPSLLNTTVTVHPTQEANTQMAPGKLPNPDNYEISDLRWDDFTEEATMPEKSIPNWARTVNPENMDMAAFDENMKIDTESLYPAEELLGEPNLDEIFKIKRARFNKRTSSAVWKTPPSNYM